MAKSDQILDFQVSMELPHRDASVGWGVGVKQVKQLPNGQKLLDFGFSSVYGIVSSRCFSWGGGGGDMGGWSKKNHQMAKNDQILDFQVSMELSH